MSAVSQIKPEPNESHSRLPDIPAISRVKAEPDESSSRLSDISSSLSDVSMMSPVKPEADASTSVSSDMSVISHVNNEPYRSSSGLSNLSGNTLVRTEPNESPSRSSESSLPTQPKAPSPSKDPAVKSNDGVPIRDPDIRQASDSIDIFVITPETALRMLCETIEDLVRMTGDIPPTPSATQSGASNLGLIQEEKENVARHLRERRHSRQNSAPALEARRAAQDKVACKLQAAMYEKRTGLSSKPPPSPPRSSAPGDASNDEDPIPSSDRPPTSPIYILDSTFETNLNLQHTLIIRKFYSKTPPSVSLASYLYRIHNYCPMTTGVYLATSLFLHRLAVVQRIIPVTARNAHRLLLAGLRVSMKKLEDQKYGHSRFAKCGGVTGPELAKLEIGFLFLTNFELMATKEMLTEHANGLREGYASSLREMGVNPVVPVKKKRETWPFLRVVDTRPPLF